MLLRFQPLFTLSDCLHYPYYRENSFQENDVEGMEIDENEDKQEGNSFFLSTEGTGSNR